jgi:hypothetical protein
METPMEIEMLTIHRSRTAISAFAAVLMLALSAPIAVHAQDQVPAEERVLVAEDRGLALAPVAGLSWDKTSGYGSVEASRAAIALPATSTTTETNRVLVAQHALAAGDLGSMQEDVLFAVVAASASWDVTSGYGSVEASRAANALATASATVTTQVPSDVRWAPDTGPAWLADSREAAARRAAPAFPEWDAARWSPIEPSQSTNPAYLPAALASGERTESAHLATVGLPREAVEARRAQLLAQFRTVELFLSRWLGAEHQTSTPGEVIA